MVGQHSLTRCKIGKNICISNSSFKAHTKLFMFAFSKASEEFKNIIAMSLIKTIVCKMFISNILNTTEV